MAGPAESAPAAIPRSVAKWLKKASAIWLRAELWTQTKRAATPFTGLGPRGVAVPMLELDGFLVYCAACTKIKLALYSASWSRT